MFVNAVQTIPEHGLSGPVDGSDAVFVDQAVDLLPTVPLRAPGRMFGPIDVTAPARGEYRQVYDGRATTAHVAFIDEIFKCSTAALNETLGYSTSGSTTPRAAASRSAAR